jgi:predicted outer membrane repeat protein
MIQRMKLLSLCLVTLIASACEGLDSGVLATCGNGEIENGEVCDDGFTDACGTCNADCTGEGSGATCGDAERCPELEACDDGFSDACGTCNADCTGEGSGGGACGDGAHCPEFEACDDGFTDACGTCNADCTGEGSGSACGDGVRCPELEACDDGFSDACGTCNADCTGAGSGSGACGDGTHCPEFEACDDGFTDACGTCNADCTGEGSGSACGDGVHCPEFEACDDDYTDACGTCNADCTGEGSGSACGDGVHCPEFETCDDGYTDACGTCNADCTGEGSGGTCGDGQWCPELELCEGSEACHQCVPVVYVDTDAPADGDGTSWEKAYRFLQDGLAAAKALQNPVEVWVAEGTYRPDESEHGAATFRDPEASFEIQSEMALYGGFSGTEVVRSERNWQEHRTVLSGDLQQDDLPEFANRLDNSCRVIRFKDTDATARLDGVVVRGGFAQDCKTGFGGGILLVDSSAIIAHCELLDNLAHHDGGGMSALRGYPTVVDSRFEANQAAGHGGGLSQSSFAPTSQHGHWVTVLRSEFIGNQASVDGGGAEGRVLVTGSRFEDNHSGRDGGGFNMSYASRVVNTLFFGNSSDRNGGGVNAGSATVNNCVFVNNSAERGGGVYGSKVVNSTFVGNQATVTGGGAYLPHTIQNSILYGNSPDQANASERAITFSCIQGLYGGAGNISNCVPLFDDDFRLKSGSPGIDAGSNSALPADTFDLDGDRDVTEPLPVDLDGNPRRVDDTDVVDTGVGTAPFVDMGAYERQ